MVLSLADSPVGVRALTLSQKGAKIHSADPPFTFEALASFHSVLQTKIHRE